ncbi:M15 family metallopeptidase [Nonomuraea sp. SBT364]|uniref:M15 family metallopeptidase n=1 Tax=Nonomuraea sp. SBT364 TaxID=1580530 RepID=UPI001E526F3F|nr:M15 family metallopeptidase [Nonomuraea sp. SBT364]
MKRAAAMTFVVFASVACGGQAPVASSAPSPPAAPTTPARTATPAPSPAATEPPEFEAEVSTVSRDRLRHSWRPGCPVHHRDLRLITMSYWGFDDKPHTGELVVRKTVTDDVVTVFRKLYDWRWPIRRMELVDVYKGDDFDSIEADNTSAFNCRRATGSGSWSNHAYGEAIDINPRENPYVTAGGDTAHKNAEKYTERPMKGKGVINPGDKVVRAFADVGWEWGGSWSGTKDYQHFSKGGG